MIDPRMQPTPQPKQRRVPATLVVWLAALAIVFLLSQIEDVLGKIGVRTGFLSFFSFLAWLVLCALTLYGFAIAIRWILRKLFWTVGRRLFLSYVMIGVLPFFLFAILLAAILYVVAGVASQANFKAERMTAYLQHALPPTRVIFFDITEEGGLIDWDSGGPRLHRRVFTLISNPWSNLVHFYFGGATSSSIMRAIF